MIFDCFTFFNEFDLLEIRLNELNDVVDQFVLVESRKTFSGLPKPLYFDINQKRYSRFLNKITHVVVDDFSLADDITNSDFYRHTAHFTSKNLSAWTNEVFQRNAIKYGLTQCHANDIIIISDLDEIPTKKALLSLKKGFSGVVAFDQSNYYFYLNCQGGDNINCSRAVHFSDLTTPQEIRFTPQFKLIKNAGWHFSFLGGAKKIKHKIASFSHQEYNTPDYNQVVKLQLAVDLGLDLFDRPILYHQTKTSDLPDYVQQHLAQYRHLLKPATHHSKKTTLLVGEILRLRTNLRGTQDRIVELQGQIDQLQSSLSQLSQELTQIKQSPLHLPFRIYTKLVKTISHAQRQ